MKKLLLIVIIFLTTHLLFAQNHNTNKFIEPNISVSYDSNYFAIGNRYSNSVYETESYDFTVKNNPNEIKILVKAKKPSIDNYSMSELKKAMTNKLSEIKKNSFDDEIEVVSYDKEVKKISDFLCLGFVQYLKPTKTNMISIICNHISESDQTEIGFVFPYSKNLDSCYKVVSEFVNGFKFYTKTQINYEDSLIKSLYSISVVEIKDTLDIFKWRKPTFLGMVKIKEPLKHKVKQVRLHSEYGEDIFEALPNGEIPIICNDKEKGEIKKQGKLIILNSFGKSVKIPFEFVYTLN